MSHDGAYGARASAAPAPGGPGSAQGANEFARAPQYPSQDNGFGGGGGGSHQQGSGGASAPHHWSPQASPYGTGAGYAANQFAAPPAPQHHGYPSSTASPYGAGVGGGAGGQAGGPYQSHSSPYSFSVPQHQQHPHHRPGPYPSYNNHDSGPTASNGAPNFSQHSAPGLSGHTGGAGGGMGGAPAYHSPGIAGMMSGMASHGSAASGHQGSYAPHYGGSALPPGGPISSSAPQPQSMGAPGYPSAPQYSTQLPLAGRHRVTTTLWEDEGTLCFQVDARGVCVARRHDNSMINGTKLLNVCGMSRGKRDGILKNEKERIVVKVGAMHLKGVWITFQRGKQLAEQNGIADVLYPLFEPNIQSFLYHPDNYPRTAAVMAAAQERQAARKSGGMPGQGPASGLDMGGGPPASSMVGSSSQDTDYPGGQASWNTPHHAQQQHHYRPVGNGANYISSAPATAAHSPAHHNHSGYNTPGSGLMQSHGSQQAGTPLSNHGSVMRSSLGSNNGTIPNDRRHSNQLDVSGGGNSMDHPGHSSNPYALSSNHSSMDNGLLSSASSSNNSNGPPTAGTLQSLPGIGSVGQRRTLSSTSYKRGYGDEDGSGPGAPNGSSSYESGGGGPTGDFYGQGQGQGGPGSERSYKRPRESGIGRGGNNGMKHEGQDENSYDTSGEYAGGAPGGGMGSAGPASVNGDKRGSGP